MIKIYKLNDKKTQRIYYFTLDNDEKRCVVCDAIVGKRFFLRRVEMFKNYWVERILCPKHENDDKKTYRNSLFGHKILVMVVDDIPEDAIVYIGMSSVTKSYGGKDLSVYDAAVTNLEDEKVVDNTRHALRESWEGSQIGANVDDLLEKKDTPLLKEKDVDDLLFDLKSSQIVRPGVEYEKIDEIEDKRAEK